MLIALNSVFFAMSSRLSFTMEPPSFGYRPGQLPGRLAPRTAPTLYSFRMSPCFDHISVAERKVPELVLNRMITVFLWKHGYSVYVSEPLH